MTDWTDKLQEELTFLHEQIVDAEHKIARYTNALDSCHECQEADSLQAMLCITQAQRDLLNELLAHQSGENALSLGSLIAQRMDGITQETERLGNCWQRGHAIPPAYWELENKHVFLADLLRRYHAWESGRPYYPPVGVNGETANGAEKRPVSTHSITGHGAYPWYIPVPRNSGITNGEHEAEDQLAALNAIQKAVYEQLRQQGFPENHFKVTAQPDDSIFITGYAHSEDERERILKVIGSIQGIREVLAGIQIVDANHCPACHPVNQTGRVE